MKCLQLFKVATTHPKQPKVCNKFPIVSTYHTLNPANPKSLITVMSSVTVTNINIATDTIIGMKLAEYVNYCWKCYKKDFNISFVLPFRRSKYRWSSRTRYKRIQLKS